MVESYPNVPAAIAQTWPSPNYDNPATRSLSLVVLNIVGLCLTIVTVAARVYTRLVVKKCFGSDDVFIVFGLGCTIACTVVLNIGILGYGWDRHIYDVEPSILAKSGKYHFLIRLTFLLTANSTHVSILCFYYRIVGEMGFAWFRKVLHGSMFFIMSAFVLFVSLFIGMCQPMSALWTYPHDPNANCTSLANVVIAGICMKTFIDILVILLPAPLILQLNMSRRQSLLILSLLSSGIVIVVAEVITTYLLYRMYFIPYDVTWAVYPTYIPGVLELDLGLICASIPALYPVVAQFFRHHQTTRKSTVSTTPSRRNTHNTLAISIRTSHPSSDNVIQAVTSENIPSDQPSYPTLSPLFAAVLCSDKSKLKRLLIKYDIDINECDASGRTVLHLAVIQGNETLVRMLLERDDLDTEREDKEGFTALDCAKMMKRRDIVTLIQEYGDMG